MPIYGTALTFKEPTAAEVPLNEELVKVIRSHHQKSREHLFHLCIIAYGLRRFNLISNKGKRGGNAKGEEYKSVFISWYEKHHLQEVYGVIGNFTKYGMSGRLLSYVAWQVDKKYIEHLPSSLTALYTCSKLLWVKGGNTNDAKRKRFSELLIKKVKDGSGVSTTRINKQSTREDIENLLPETESELSPSPSKLKSTGKTKHKFVGLAEVLVNKDIYKFTSTHTKRGHLKIEDVDKLNSAIANLVKKFDAGRQYFSIQSSLPKIKEKYNKEANPDFGKAIRTKAAKSKAPAKKTTKR
jgi:hypothetical protein